MKIGKKILVVGLLSILSACGQNDASQTKQDDKSSPSDISQSDNPSASSPSNQGTNNCYKKLYTLDEIKSAGSVIMVALYDGTYYAYTGNEKEKFSYYHEGISVGAIESDGSTLELSSSACELALTFSGENSASIKLKDEGAYLWAGYVTSDGKEYANIGLKDEETIFTFDLVSDGNFQCYSSDKVYLEYYQSSFQGAKEKYKDNALVSFYTYGYSEAKASSSADSDIDNVDPTPSEKWQGLDFTKYGDDFRADLQKLIKGYKTSSCTYSKCLSIGAKAAAYPAGSSTFVPFYHSAPNSGSSGSLTTTTSSCNREHTWPNSRGCGENGGPSDDPFIIRPTISKENSGRGNSFYGTASSSWDPASYGYEGARGEAARVILYAATAYYGTCGSGGNSKGNKPFELVDKDTDDQNNHTMGRLSLLLKWNKEYPVSAMEIQINDYLCKNGYGRNPFVDVPSYADYIWTSSGKRTSPLA